MDIGAPSGPKRTRIAVLLGLFALLALALALLERVGLESGRTPQMIAAGALVLFVLVGALANGRRPTDHYVAAQEVSSRLGGVATAGAMAGLLVLAMSGPEAATGSGLLSLILGVLVGLAFLSFWLAPRLRMTQAYGAGDFVGVRFGLPARLLAAAAGLASSGMLYLAFLKAILPIVAILFGVERETGLYAAAAMSAVLLLPGGQRSLVWTQAMQAIVMAAGCLAAIGILAGSAETSIGLSIGGALVSLQALLAVPGGQSGLAGFLLPIILIAAGTASLPFLLNRTLSARSSREAARSMAWGLLGATLFVAGGLTLAAFLDSEAGVAIGGFLAGDLLQQGTLVGVLPSVGSGILLAGALAAVLAIGQAALLAAAGNLSHDVWDEAIDRRGPAGRRIVVARLCIVAVAAAAAWLEPQVAMSPFALVSWALALGAAGLLAPLVMGLWWRACTPLGATLGIAAGLAVGGFFLFLNVGGSPGLDRIAGDAGVGPLAATAFGMAANFLVAAAASTLRSQPAAGAQKGRFPGRRATITERPA